MQTNHPTKEQVRYWQQLRLKSRLPVPSLDEVRQQLGWKLIPGNPR